jgi:RNA polymerase sigma-70 factor (ECF subfamily)
VESRTDPDLALVARCKDPSSDDFEAAFEVLYSRYRDRVYTIAYRITGKNADAMDVVQETFSLLFRKVGEFRGEALFSTWLFRIVVNCAIDSRRQRGSAVLRRTTSLQQRDDEPEPPDEGGVGPADKAQASELGDHVHVCLQRVSPKFRAILVLRYLEEMSYEELCDALELSMGTVKSRLARAHMALQRELVGTLEPFGYRADTAGNYSFGSTREGLR